MDSKLKLKPVELLDVGIDKHTKIPIPILNENILSEFDMENGLPTDTFIMTFNSSVCDFNMTVKSSTDISLYLDYGDNTFESWVITSNGTSILHTYLTGATYTIIATGWLDKITDLIILGGLVNINLNSLKKLNSLDLQNNLLETLSLDGLIYLNTISLNNNYFPNDVIDDLYIDADTFLTYNGYMSTIGNNNGIPSVYSDVAINSLTNYKFWSLNYNT